MCRVGRSGVSFIGIVVVFVVVTVVLVVRISFCRVVLLATARRGHLIGNAAVVAVIPCKRR